MLAETIEVLERDIDLADKADRAYNLYCRKFIAQSKDKVHAAFDGLSIDDVDSLKRLKMMQSVITSLETNILADIDAGKIARKQMEDYE